MLVFGRDYLRCLTNSDTATPPKTFTLPHNITQALLSRETSMSVTSVWKDVCPMMVWPVLSWRHSLTKKTDQPLLRK